MTTAGLLILIASVSSVTFLFAWCIWKILSTPGESERVHGLEKVDDLTND